MNDVKVANPFKEVDLFSRVRAIAVTGYDDTLKLSKNYDVVYKVENGNLITLRSDNGCIHMSSFEEYMPAYNPNNAYEYLKARKLLNYAESRLTAYDDIPGCWVSVRYIPKAGVVVLRVDGRHELCISFYSNLREHVIVVGSSIMLEDVCNDIIPEDAKNNPVVGPEDFANLISRFVLDRQQGNNYKYTKVFGNTELCWDTRKYTISDSTCIVRMPSSLTACTSLSFPTDWNKDIIVGDDKPSELNMWHGELLFRQLNVIECTVDHRAAFFDAYKEHIDFHVNISGTNYTVHHVAVPAGTSKVHVFAISYVSNGTRLSCLLMQLRGRYFVWKSNKFENLDKLVDYACTQWYQLVDKKIVMSTLYAYALALGNIGAPATTITTGMGGKTLTCKFTPMSGLITIELADKEIFSYSLHTSTCSDTRISTVDLYSTYKLVQDSVTPINSYDFPYLRDTLCNCDSTIGTVSWRPTANYYQLYSIFMLYRNSILCAVVVVPIADTVSGIWIQLNTDETDDTYAVLMKEILRSLVGTDELFNYYCRKVGLWGSEDLMESERERLASKANNLQCTMDEFIYNNLL